MPTATRLEIITVASPRAAVLRRKARPVGRVTREVAQLIDAMLATMEAAGGLGLAAPQVGESVRVFVARVEDRTLALVDPEIVRAEGEITDTEGCLSIPGVIGEVPRAAAVTVRGKTRRGRRVTIPAEGLLARVIQHEIDHLDGVLFLDRVRDPATIRQLSVAAGTDAAAPQAATTRAGDAHPAIG
ncbi:MAG: peptide deformylase [Armatimonadota bacterium]|nr:peptide deformylase [Armatimonadota bacterium]MDR7533941.1 peptide deformylase [Armatimonadota bacterium]MDR7536045.1 peptide deformylase [Armatimonadota bacterium]